MIEAAGGAVWRATPQGVVEVLVVHRPRYDDWSLPKGKFLRGERALACAVREVEEETGLRCDAGPELLETRYRDRKGRNKRVRYWAMTARGGTFTANSEVDRVRWVPVEAAAKHLTYDRDVAVVASLVRAVRAAARLSA